MHTAGNEAGALPVGLTHLWGDTHVSTYRINAPVGDGCEVQTKWSGKASRVSRDLVGTEKLARGKGAIFQLQKCQSQIEHDTFRKAEDRGVVKSGRGRGGGGGGRQGRLGRARHRWRWSQPAGAGAFLQTSEPTDGF